MSESVLTKTKTIAYWADGFWMENVEEAEVADKYNSFGDMKHRLLDVPEDSEKEEITRLIGVAITNEENKEETIRESEPDH